MHSKTKFKRGPSPDVISKKKKDTCMELSYSILNNYLCFSVLDLYYIFSGSNTVEHLFFFQLHLRFAVMIFFIQIQQITVFFSLILLKISM